MVYWFLLTGHKNLFFEIWDSVRSKIAFLFDTSWFFWAGLVEIHNSNYIKYNIYIYKIYTCRMRDCMQETKYIVFICYIKCFEIIFQKHLLKHLSWPNSFIDCTSYVPLYLPICVLLIKSTHYFCVSCVKIAVVMVVENLVPFSHRMVISDSEWNPCLCSRPMSKKAPQKVTVVDFVLLLSVFHKNKQRLLHFTVL